MKRVYYLFTLACSFTLFACSHKSSDIKQSNDKNTITINLESPQSLHASRLFDTIIYVPLETSDTYIFSRASHLKVNDEKDLYFISDKSFFLFDGETGKGKVKISRLGNGPDGYTSIFDSNVDSSTKEIELLDNNAKKIVIYDMDGNHKRSMSLPFMSFMFAKTGKDDYWFYNNNLLSEASDHKVVHFVSNKGKIKEYDKIDKHLAKYFFIDDEKNLIVQNGNLLYHYSPSDTIYQIRPDKEMRAAYVLDMGKNLAPKEFYARNFRDIMEFVETANNNGYVFEIPTFSANDQTIVVACIKEGKPYITFHTKENGKSMTFSSFHDDYNALAPLSLDVANLSFCMDNDYFYFIITAEQLIESKNKGYYREPMEKWIESRQITEFSNPILVKCKF